MLGKQIPPGTQDCVFLDRAESGAFRGPALRLLFLQHNKLVKAKGVAYHPFGEKFLPYAAFS